MSDLTTPPADDAAVLTLVTWPGSSLTPTQKIRSLSGRCQLAVLKYQQIDGRTRSCPSAPGRSTPPH
ncbi:MAG: hypothetical protein ACLRIS_20185 [Flavonifractor plautii]